MCTVSGCLQGVACGLRVLPIPDGVCHPGAGTASLQDGAEAAGCPLHPGALGGSAQGAAAAHRAVWAPQGLSIRVVWAPLDPSCPPRSLFTMALLCLEEMPRLSRGSLPLKVTLSQHRCAYPASLHKETEVACVSGAGLILEVKELLSTLCLSPAPQPAPGQGKDWGREHKGLSHLCAGVLYSPCQAVASDTVPRQWVHPTHSPPTQDCGERQPSAQLALGQAYCYLAGRVEGRGRSQAWSCILPC